MDIFNYSNLFKAPDGSFIPVPFVPISKRSTDIPMPYYQGISRLYLLSNDTYGSPYYGQLILLANPEYVSEHEIPDGTFLRVPYPLDSVLQEIAAFQTDWLSQQRS
jgi:hypothetical protein